MGSKNVPWHSLPLLLFYRCKMRRWMLEELESVVDFPVYLFKKNATGYTCTKIERYKDEFKTKTYFITAKSQCTCMSWLKVGECKHLHIVNDRSFWIGAGVSGEYAADEANRIMDVVGPKIFQITDIRRLKPEDVGSVVTCITFPVKNFGKDKFDILFYVKQFPDKQRMGVRFLAE